MAARSVHHNISTHVLLRLIELAQTISRWGLGSAVEWPVTEKNICLRLLIVVRRSKQALFALLLPNKGEII